MDALLRRFRSAFLIVGFFSFVINLLMLSMPLFMLQLFSRVLQSRSNETLLMLFLMTLFALTVAGWLDAIRVQLLNRVGSFAQRQLRVPAVETLWQWSPRGQTRDQSLEDVQTLSAFLSQPVKAFFDLPWFPVFLGIIYLFHPLLAVVTVIGALIMIALAIAEEGVEKKALATSSEAKTRAQRFLREALTHHESISGLGMRDNVVRRWLRLHDAYLSNHEGSTDATSRINGLAQVTRGLVRMIGLTTAAWLIINTPNMSSGIMIASSMLMGQALTPIGAVIGAWKAFVKARQAYTRLRVVASDYQHQSEARASRLNLPRPIGRLVVEQAHLVLKDRLILNNLSFQLQPGESLGVVGLNAAGKTSLARLLVGLFPPTSGRVTLDGADIHPWMQAGLGQYLGYLPQQIELFSGTVAENIARLGEVDQCEDAIIQAARLARVHDLILRLPKGYDTDIGEGGNTLSGGQRQLLALARALYGDPALVVLDEPNASLDGQAEMRLLETLRELKTMGVTVVIVSHKPSVLKDVDKLLVLNQGRQVHHGPRAAILEVIYKGRAEIALNPDADETPRFPRQAKPGAAEEN
ncbi:MAG: type I secretion system permease/ATPase [Candidatus Competibacteraceae bacterium]|nr:type I secretion system permease/ATPase [Candidatus Competibacteraceae bacterium]